MLKFNDIVVDILQEQVPVVSSTTIQQLQQVDGFKNLLAAYRNQYGGEPSITDIEKAVGIIQGGTYIAAKYTNIGYIPFIDAFAQIFAQINDKNKRSYSMPQIYDIVLKTPDQYNNVFNEIITRVQQSTSVQDYEPINPDVNKAARTLNSEVQKLSQTAIQSLGSESVHTAINKMIAKRVSVLDRVIGLKSLTKPFDASLITPVLHQFKKYAGVKNWAKRIPGDFNKMVDDISASNLLNVAILASEYYIHLLKTKYLTGEQPKGESLAPFENLYQNIILEMPLKSAAEIGKDIAAGERRPMGVDPEKNKWTKNQYNKDFDKKLQPPKNDLPPLNEQQIQKIANQIGNTVDPDYKSFLDKGASQFLPGVKYDLNAIAKDPSREAKDLYKALTDMAYFVRQRTSLSQAIGKTAGALGALRVGMGPVG
jgi:hypothetical protein